MGTSLENRNIENQYSSQQLDNSQRLSLYANKLQESKSDGSKQECDSACNRDTLKNAMSKDTTLTSEQKHLGYSIVKALEQGTPKEFRELVGQGAKDMAVVLPYLNKVLAKHGMNATYTHSTDPADEKTLEIKRTSDGSRIYINYNSINDLGHTHERSEDFETVQNRMLPGY